MNGRTGECVAVRVPATFGFRVMALLGAIALSSCAGADEERLIVATNLSESETDRIEAALDHPSIRLVWLRVHELGDPATLLDRRLGIDVVLGAPIESYQRLQRLGGLETLRGTATTLVYRRAEVGWVVKHGTTRKPVFADVALDDPRHSTVALAALRARLDQDGWGASYRVVLSIAAQHPMIGANPGEGLARLERGEVPTALTPSDRVPEGCEFTPMVPSVLLEHGIGIVRGTPHLEAAREFVASLMRQTDTATTTRRDPLPPPQVLLPELLGAVLVDTQPELIEAMAAVKAAGLEKQAERWFVPPPWPPASIAKLKRSDPTGALAESLAEQVVPDLKARVWLLESWNRTSRPIDGDLLRELTSAADGRLIAEPRFRAWLAVEWRSWARQCYRRIAREARRVRR
jgi:hypothetical protein